MPKTLTEAQVEALLDALDVNTPLGLRDRAMLELIYASGFRVSELASLKTLSISMSEGVLRVLGKGSKERLGLFGQIAHDWISRHLIDTRLAVYGRTTWNSFTPWASLAGARSSVWYRIAQGLGQLTPQLAG